MLALESHKRLVKLRSNCGQIIISLRNKSVAIPKKCMSQSPFRQRSLGPGVSRHLRPLTGAVCEHACGGAAVLECMRRGGGVPTGSAAEAVPSSHI